MGLGQQLLWGVGIDGAVSQNFLYLLLLAIIIL